MINSPILVRLMESVRHKTRLFRFNNGWHLLPEYEAAVEKGLNVQMAGNVQFRLVKQLKAVKTTLKLWNRELPRPVSSQKEAELRDVQDRLHLTPQDPLLACTERRSLEQVRSLTLQEEIQLAQRAKCTWLKEDDLCTKFFYDIIRTRQLRVQHQNTMSR